MFSTTLYMILLLSLSLSHKFRHEDGTVKFWDIKDSKSISFNNSNLV